MWSVLCWIRQWEKFQCFHWIGETCTKWSFFQTHPNPKAQFWQDYDLHIVKLSFPSLLVKNMWQTDDDKSSWILIRKRKNPNYSLFISFYTLIHSVGKWLKKSLQFQSCWAQKFKMNFLDNFQTPSFVFQKEYLLFINKYFLKGPLGVISWKKTQQVVIDLFPRKASVWVWLFF